MKKNTMKEGYWVQMSQSRVAPPCRKNRQVNGLDTLVQFVQHQCYVHVKKARMVAEIDVF